MSQANRVLRVAGAGVPPAGAPVRSLVRRHRRIGSDLVLDGLSRFGAVCVIAMLVRVVGGAGVCGVAEHSHVRLAVFGDDASGVRTS